MRNRVRAPCDSAAVWNSRDSSSGWQAANTSYVSWDERDGRLEDGGAVAMGLSMDGMTSLYGLRCPGTLP